MNITCSVLLLDSQAIYAAIELSLLIITTQTRRIGV
jgi:hypothetical protein